jgi:hypothetical protein
VAAIAQHGKRVATRALNMNAEPLAVRAAVATGVVTAGVVPGRRVAFDVFGCAVDLAARLEGHATPNQVLVSQTTKDESDYCLDFHAPITVEPERSGGQALLAYTLIGVKSAYRGGGKPVKKTARIVAPSRRRTATFAQSPATTLKKFDIANEAEVRRASLAVPPPHNDAE